MLTFAIIQGSRIVQIGSAPDHDTMMMQDGIDGVQVIAFDPAEGIGTETHFWDGAEFQPLPPPPGPWAVWAGAAWIDPRDDEEVQEDSARHAESAIRDLRGFAGAEIEALAQDYQVGASRQQDALIADAAAYLAAIEAGGDPAAYKASIPLRGWALRVRAATAAMGAPASDGVVQAILAQHLWSLVSDHDAWRKRVAIIEAEVFVREGLIRDLVSTTENAAAMDAQAVAGRAAIIDLRGRFNHQLDDVLGDAP